MLVFRHSPLTNLVVVDLPLVGAGRNAVRLVGLDLDVVDVVAPVGRPPQLLHDPVDDLHAVPFVVKWNTYMR